MSASLLSGNAALGHSASALKPGGAKSQAKGSPGESAFQLAIGSAGEGGRQAADRQQGADAGQSAPKAEEVATPASRSKPTDEAAPRLHEWLLGMDSGPPAGDLLLSGGALTPEKKAPGGPTDAGDTGGGERRPRELPSHPETGTKASAIDTTPSGASQRPDDEIDEMQVVADDGTPSGSSAGKSGEAPDPAEAARRPVAEAPKPAPVDGGPAPPMQVGVDNPAGGRDPVADRHTVGNTGIMNSEPQPDATEKPARFDRIGTQAAPQPTLTPEQIPAAEAKAVPDRHNPQPVAAGHSPAPVAAMAGQGIVNATRQSAAGTKAAPSPNGDRFVERPGADVQDGADDAIRQDRLRIDDTGRNLQPRDTAGDQRPDRRSPSADQPLPPAVARDASGGQTTAPTAQSPTVTVVEARQYVAPQQTNAEAIVRAVSGNELWSAALRNESAVRNGTPLQTLKIRLNPAELGMVDATLRLAGDRLVVELNVQTTEAYRQLSDNRQNVLNALRGQGYGVEQISVQLSAPDRGGQPGTSTGQQQGGFEGQTTQDNSQQSGEGGRSGQESGNGENRESGNVGRGETPAGETSALPPGVAADGSVYL